MEKAEIVTLDIDQEGPRLGRQVRYPAWMRHLRNVVKVGCIHFSEREGVDRNMEKWAMWPGGLSGPSSSAAEGRICVCPQFYRVV